MSNASNRNIGAMVRERDRRTALSLDSPGTPGLAQAAYLSPSWDALYGSLREGAGEGGYRLSGNGMSDPGNPGGGTTRPGDEDIARTWGINTALGDMTDQRRVQEQALRGITAGNDAADVAASDRQAVDRGMAIANTPGVSQNGAPILKRPDGSYVTAQPGAAAPPVDRRQVATQMAPGLIQPTPPVAPVTFGAPTAAMVNGKRVFVRAGSDGQMYGTDRKPIAPDQLAPVAAAGSGSNDNVVQAVNGMKEGTIPPQLPGRASKEYVEMLAEAHRQGYDLAGAATDWMATQKHISTLNGAQQLRLNQAINQLPDLLDSVDELASQWKGGRFPVLNKANLALAKGGAYGPEVASVATRLDAQIADVTGDLGSVYMGGNSPTDHSLKLAEKSLSADWDEKVLHDMVKLAKGNVVIRRNSVNNTGVAGASADNAYAPPADKPTPAGKIVVKAPDGSSHPFETQAQADAFKKLAGIK